MKKFIRILFVCVFAFGLNSISFIHAQGHVFPGEEWSYHEETEDAGYDMEKLRDVIPFLRDSMNTTGLVIVVGGKIMGELGDVEELSYLASCRKSILAMLYGKYVEDGTIDLNLTMHQLGISDIDGLMDVEEKATVAHLITARSGVYHPASNAGDNLADAPPRGSQEPGAYFLYNNWDFNAAGAVFEQLTDQTIYEALEKDLADPLQFQDWDIDAQRKSGNTKQSRYKAYHIWLSTRDMARIGLLMLHQGKWNDTQVVPKAWTEKIVSVITPNTEMNPERIKNGEFGYGYMWWVWDGPDAIGPYEGAYTARGAWGQYITVLPKLDMVISHKTKAEYGRRTGWKEYKKLMEMIFDAKIE